MISESSIVRLICRALLVALVGAAVGIPSEPPSWAAEGSNPQQPSREERCRAEVVELHRFLEAWSNATLPDSEQAFARFGDVIAPSFVIIDPDGKTLGRDPIVEAIRAAHGRWSAEPGRIRIENFRLLQSGDGYSLATYEEWHEIGAETVGRLSSVLFGPNESAPNGLEWLHLHEVWIKAD